MSDAEHAPPPAPPAPAGAEPDLRAKLAIALDVDDLVVATRIAREVAPWFGVAKIGLELYSAVGPDAVTQLLDLGFDVFCDLKMFDIPNTVNRAAKVIGSLGVRYLTIHASGGVPVLRAGVEGFCDGASLAGLPEPVPLAVTILTSDNDAPPHILPKRVQIAREAGASGLVCAASDVRQAKQLAPRMVTVVPGIRPAGSATHDQARPATPEYALAEGADLLVVGRAVTAAEDRAAAAETVAAALA